MVELETVAAFFIARPLIASAGKYVMEKIGEGALGKIGEKLEALVANKLGSYIRQAEQSKETALIVDLTKPTQELKAAAQVDPEIKHSLDALREKLEKNGAALENGQFSLDRHPISQIHFGSGDNVGRDKIENQYKDSIIIQNSSPNTTVQIHSGSEDNVRGDKHQETIITERIYKGANLSNLDQKALKKIKEIYHATMKSKPGQLRLDTLGFLQKKNLIEVNITYTALILLGDKTYLNRHLPTTGIWYKYYKNEYADPESLLFTGPFLLRFADIMQTITKNNKKGSFFNEDIIAEGILNAVVHRNYEIENDNIYINHYGGAHARIQISSPGKSAEQLLETFTLNSIPHIRSYKVNHLLLTILRELGFIKESGEGILKIFRMCILEGKDLPLFSTDSNTAPNRVVLEIPGVKAKRDKKNMIPLDIELRKWFAKVYSIKKEKNGSEFSLEKIFTIYELVNIYKIHNANNESINLDPTIYGKALEDLCKDGYVIKTARNYRLNNLTK